MRLSLLFFFICIANYSFGQAPVIQWQRCLGGLRVEHCGNICETTDGGYIVAGYTDSDDGDVSGNHGFMTEDYWVVKLSASGAIEWQKCYGGTNDDRATAIRQTTDGGYIVAGYTGSGDGDVLINNGGYDGWVIKLSATGSIVWQKSVGSSGNDKINDIRQTADGGFVVAGVTDQSGSPVKLWDNYWVVKFSATGAVQWENIMGGDNFETARAISQTSDGGYIVNGYAASVDGDITSNIGSYDYWVVKLYATGAIEWQKNYGGTGLDRGTAVIQTTDGGYIAVGSTFSNDGHITNHHQYVPHTDTNASTDYWLVKMSPTGAIEWQNCIGGFGNDEAESIHQTTDGSYIVVGYSCSYNGDITHHYIDTVASDIWVAKVSSAGTILWQKSIGGSGYEYATSVIQSSDFSYVIAGYTGSNDFDVSGNHSVLNDLWVVKLAPETGTLIPAFTKAVSIFPNPTTGTISVKGDGVSQIRVFNTTGCLLKNTVQTGNVSVADLPQGIYYVRVYGSQGQVLYAAKLIKE